MSRFIQNYNQHLAEAERTDDILVLNQRAGRTTWVLETQHRARETAQATRLLSDALATLVQDGRMAGAVAAALAQTLPWVELLPEQDREEFVKEVTKTLRACASVGRFTAFNDLVDDWQNTAETWADPSLASALSQDIDEPLDLPVDTNA